MWYIWGPAWFLPACAPAICWWKWATKKYVVILNYCCVCQRLVLIALWIWYISVVTFLRVQWEPFETQFWKVSSSFKYHLGVLDHSIQALQFNAIQNGNRTAETERQRIQWKEETERQRRQHKELGMICSNLLAVLEGYLLIGQIIEEKSSVWTSERPQSLSGGLAPNLNPELVTIRLKLTYPSESQALPRPVGRASCCAWHWVLASFD